MSKHKKALHNGAFDNALGKHSIWQTAASEAEAAACIVQLSRGFL